MHHNLTIKAAFISALAFALSMVLMQPFAASASALFSAPERNDFTLSDFYIMTADGRAVARMDTNIVIINVDRADRADIAYALDLLGLCAPACIGMDVIFADEREGDETLIAALDRTPSIIHPLNMLPYEGQTDTFFVSETSYFYAPQLADDFASTGLPAKYDRGVVREFRPKFATREGADVDGFATALVRRVSPEAVEKLRERNHSLETINFHSRRFMVIEPEEIMDHAEDITGRIVLFGAMNEPSDVHPTPVNSAMPGIVLHAHAIATILDGDYLNTPPKWVQFALAFALCFLIVWLGLRNTTKTKGLMLRVTQIACVLALVQTGYWLFIRHNIVFDTSNALLMVMFGLFAADIWLGLEGLYEMAMGSPRVQKLRQKFFNNNQNQSV